MSLFAATFRWLQRKRYQYEVTFSLYMLTPTEKFIFNTVILTIFSMVIIAACLYLPQHISFITKRAWFYYHGEDAGTVGSRVPLSQEGMMGTLESNEVVMETARAVVGAVLEGEKGRRAVTGEL